MKVRCSMCVKHVDGHCKPKKAKTEPNKSRICKKFAESPLKKTIASEKERKASAEIPHYKQTHRVYDGTEGAEYVLVNPKTALIPKKLVKRLEKVGK